MTSISNDFQWHSMNKAHWNGRQNGAKRWQFSTFVTQTKRIPRTIRNNTKIQVVTATNIHTNSERKSSWQKVRKVATFFQWKCPWAKANASNSIDTRLFDASCFSTKNRDKNNNKTNITKTLDMEIECEQKKIIIDLCGLWQKVRICLSIFCSEILDGLLDLCMRFVFMSTSSSSFRNKFSMRDLHPKWTFSLSSVWIRFYPLSIIPFNSQCEFTCMETLVSRKKGSLRLFPLT